MTIGEKIKYCRKQIGITQDKLAELTGIHPVLSENTKQIKCSHNLLS
mgnify:CR=1 FL=1